MSNIGPHFQLHSIPHLKRKTLVCTLAALGFVGAAPVYSVEEFADKTELTAEQKACLPALITPRPEVWPKSDLSEKVGPMQEDEALLNQPIRIRADDLQQQGKQSLSLSGDVELEHPKIRIYSDDLQVDLENKRAQMQGNIRLLQEQFSLTAQQLDIDEQNLKIGPNRYQIIPSRAYGESDAIEVNQQKQRAELKSASLTTCKLNSKGKKDWDLQAREIVVDQQKQRVIARDATLKVREIPIFYSPYFDYPLNDRASGLLFPEIGSYKALNNDERTQYIKIPYYFALAPNYDDTVNIIPMSQQGLALDNEFRYLGNLSGSRQRWEVETSLYRSDESLSEAENPRWRMVVNNQQQWGEHVNARINWHQTSDANVYNDAPIDKDYTNATRAPQEMQLNYQSERFSAHALYSGYEKLINFQNNYEKRPEVGMQYRQPLNALTNSALPGDLDWYFNSQVTDFRLKETDTSRAEGMRWHNQSGLRYQQRKTYGQFNAQLNAYYSDYQLDNSVVESEERFIPQAVIDGGLIFDRPVSVAGKTYTQTLEPQIQYLYTAYREQNQLPLFDSALRSPDFSNLFALNPYVGSDRIADTHQVSVALSSHFIDASGKERLNLGIGQLYRFTESKVLAEDGFNGDSGASDIYTKAQLNLDALRLHSTLVFDPQQKEFTASSNRVFWQVNERNELFINHIKMDQTSSQANESLMLGGYSKLNQNWQMSLVTNYDLDLNQTVESQLSLRFDSCCWAVSATAERTQLANDLYNDSIQFQFEFKGLSNNDQSLKKNLSNLFNF
ncbi:LPS-assembly protein LptD [Thiomicrorhabdus sp. 6S3-12]|uniref:LPS-assembly protein LptD n=1 Tax=Thiomicrorhabdus sp. 6S3-12 TaxID=2819681 RepID=UPI001AAC6F09|nr:LPS assembly protein LptD [Thiomicrorhabdus sp. 6S3-12]MBO1922904.1 LPS-assembly protein LptD [Thiomicrorhabdus sp. 6S3-12]